MVQDFKPPPLRPGQKKEPPVDELMVLGIAALAYAMNPTTINPREAFVVGRSFVAEAKAQMPEVIKILMGG